MIGIFGKLSSEFRTFNLDKINIEDEGMEDLEKFNQIYKIQNSKCTLFGDVQKVQNFNTSFFLDNSYNYESSNNNGSEKSISIFRIELYLRRLIENMKRQKIKNLILELGSLSSNNFLILTKIKSIRSNWSKEKLIDIAVDIILRLIKFNDN